MPPEIRGLANSILHEPHVVELTSSKPAETIAHELYPVPEAKKIDLLMHVLSQPFESAIIFTRTKHRAKRLAEKLSKTGHAAVALQGNMSQAQREKAMGGFRKNKFNVLVATDIAARGIDVAQVSHVINFDIPNTPEAYTHRIGRTGRAERSGQAFTFVTGEDRSMVRAIERKLGKPIARASVSGITDEDVMRGGHDRDAQHPSNRPFDGRRPGGYAPRNSRPGGYRSGGRQGQGQQRNNSRVAG
jgi:ATP-dependent RNA helicase RhlE